ncbi:MAG: ABC transporter ATP-binding protein, partial [Lachnospiraceae bacterium]|nr:ABC transporter ATP-binding protein [Lachnospiraceae bacterium]
MAEHRKKHGGPMGRGPGVPPEKAKNFKGTVKKLTNYAKQYTVQIILVVIFAIGSTIFNIAGPKVLGKATTELGKGLGRMVAGTGGIDFDRIGQILLLLLGMYVISAVFSFIQGWIMTGVSQKMCYNLRAEISKKLNRLPIRYYESRTVGEVLSRVTNDIDTLQMSFNQCITQLITSVTTLIGVLIMMLSISPIMTLVAFVILPLSGAFVGIVVKKSQKYFIVQQKYLGEINGQIEEVYSGHNIVKAFNREQIVTDEFDKTNDILYKSAWKSQFLSGMMQPIMSFIGNLGYVAVAVLGSYLAIKGSIQIGDIQSFIQYVRSFTQPISQLAQVSNMFQSMIAASERVFELLDEEEE